MFTGLIEALGRIDDVHTHAAADGLRVTTPLAAELGAGDSIAVNGVCLTVASTIARESFPRDVSPETLRVTTLGRLAAGRAVNLERPLRADARLGGHFVLGHVDGVGRDRGRRRRRATARWLDVDVPAGAAAVR